MRFLPLIIAFQLLTAGLILNLSTNSASATEIRQMIKSVLGSSIIAQDVQPTDTPQDQPPPSDTPPNDQTPPSPASNQQPASNSQPTETPSPLATDIPLQDQVNYDQTNPQTSPEASPSETPLQSPSLPETPLPSELPSTISESSSQLEVANASEIAINSDDLISSPIEVDKETQHKANQEDQSLENETPEKQQTLLINYASNKILDLAKTIKSDDYATTSFLTQRLNDQLDKAQNIIASNPTTANAGRQSLKKFCSGADLILKTEQLAVPEELEQDIEITRGKCLNIQ